MIMERQSGNRRVAHNVRGLGTLGDDVEIQSDGSTITYGDDGSTMVVNADGTTTIVNADGSGGTYDASGAPTSTALPSNLPVQTVPIGTVLQPLLSDPGKLIRMGTQIYRYYKTTNAQGQLVYQPALYSGSSGALSNPIVLLALAAGAFLLLS